MFTAEYFTLRGRPLKECGRPIAPVRRGEWASEYNDFVANYTSAPVALTNRIIPPYCASETHGAGVFDGVVRLIAQLKCRSILDLGCGSGELLLRLRDAQPGAILLGASICLGEVAYARERGLHGVMPIDMREIADYYEANSLDCVVAHCCLQFVPEEDRGGLQQAVHHVLKGGGHFLVVDYKGKQGTGLASIHELSLIHI